MQGAAWSNGCQASVALLVQKEQNLLQAVRAADLERTAQNEMCHSAEAAKERSKDLRLAARSAMTRGECASISQLDRALYERNSQAKKWSAATQEELDQARAEEEEVAARLRTMRGGVEEACMAVSAMEQRIHIAQLPATPLPQVWDENEHGPLVVEVTAALNAMRGAGNGAVSLRTLAVELQHNQGLAEALRVQDGGSRERFLCRVHALVRARRNEHEQSWAGGAADAFDDLVEIEAIVDAVFSPPAEVALLLRECRAFKLESARKHAAPPPEELEVEEDVRRQLEEQVETLRDNLRRVGELSGDAHAQLLADEGPVSEEEEEESYASAAAREEAEQATLRKEVDALRARRTETRAQKRAVRDQILSFERSAGGSQPRGGPVQESRGGPVLDPRGGPVAVSVPKEEARPRAAFASLTNRFNFP